MKRLLLIVLCLSMVMLSSCQAEVKDSGKSEADTAESTITTTTTTTTTTATTTTTTPYNPEELVYEKLAKLTKEDGTGEISLDMSAQEIVAVLDKYGIEYDDYQPDEEYKSGHVSISRNGYCTKYYDKYGQFSLQQSYKGLKVGDDLDRVLELYGEPDEIVSNGSPDKFYIYVQKELAGLMSCTIHNLFFKFGFLPNKLFKVQPYTQKSPTT